MNPTDAKRWLAISTQDPTPTPDGVAAYRNHDGDYYCTTCVGRIMAGGKDERTLRLIPVLDKSPTARAIVGLWCDCCGDRFEPR